MNMKEYNEVMFDSMERLVSEVHEMNVTLKAILKKL